MPSEFLSSLNSTSYSLRVFFWVQRSNSYSETVLMCRGLNHLKLFDLPITFVEHSSNLLIYNLQIKEGDQRDWPKAVSLIFWLYFCLCLLSLFHDLLLHFRLRRLFLPFPISFSLCSYLPEGSYLWDTATDMRWSSSPSIFLPSGSTDEYFGREKQFNEVFSVCMWVCSGASVLYFVEYLKMEAKCRFHTPDGTINIHGSEPNQPFEHIFL